MGNRALKIGAVVLGTAFAGVGILAVAENSLREYDLKNCETRPEYCPPNVGDRAHLTEFFEFYAPRLTEWGADIFNRVNESPATDAVQAKNPAYDEVGMQIVLSGQDLTP